MTTITEALAEIKTLKKRINKKRTFIYDHMFLGGQMKDPFENEGGSQVAIDKATQAARDMENRVVELRLAIAKKNAETEVTLEGVTRSIAGWIIWRREVAHQYEEYLGGMSRAIQTMKQKAMKQDMELLEAGDATNGEVRCFLSSAKLFEERDTYEKIMGALDGQLSVVNATTHIDA